MELSRRKFVFNAAAAGSISILGFPGPAEAQIARQDGLILGKGPKGRCDDAKNGGPFVVWREDEQLWWLYYYCRSTDFPEGVAPGFGTGSIALAKSRDAINWERFDGPLKGGAIMVPDMETPGAFDSEALGLGNVIYHDGEWIMTYFGGDSIAPEIVDGVEVHEGYKYKGYRCRPGIARSKDGINWTRIKGSSVGGASVSGEDYIYSAFPTTFHDGEQFVMYYTALSPKVAFWDTRVAVSKNLVDWEEKGSAQWKQEPKRWETQGIVTRHIIENPLSVGGKWLKIYAGLDGRFFPAIRQVALATSNDGFVWNHLYDEPIFGPGNINNWDGGGTAYPHIFPVGENFHMVYYGFANKYNKEEPGRGIGLAISNGKDMQSFRRPRPEG
ncbi:MAG: hypothetical protein AAGE37_00915 [Pseudomonadota bacterium]